MRFFKVALMCCTMAFGGLVATSIGEPNAAYAKAHAKKGKPGQCGMNYYYDKKERMCVNATFKK